MKTINLVLDGKTEGSIKRFDTFNKFEVTLSPNSDIPCLNTGLDTVEFMLQGTKVNQKTPAPLKVKGSIVRADTGVLAIDFTKEDYEILDPGTYLVEAHIQFHDPKTSAVIGLGIYPTSNHFLLNIVESF